MNIAEQFHPLCRLTPQAGGARDSGRDGLNVLRNIQRFADQKQNDVNLRNSLDPGLVALSLH